MSRVVHVEDPADARLADYHGLRDPARRSRTEPDGGFFVAEGVTVIERLLASETPVRSLLLNESKLHRLGPLLEGVDAPVYVVGADTMEGVVGFDLHRGALASAQRPRPMSLSEALVGQRLVCALEGINDHENLGAIMRSAAAFGIRSMVLDRTCADPWYRRSVRVSMGTVFDLSFVRATRWPETVEAMREMGFRVIALTVGPHSKPIEEVPVGPPTVVMLGAEGPGLTESAVKAADLEATIPIESDVDSLNVGHAAAIAFHRLRQPAAAAD